MTHPVILRQNYITDIDMLNAQLRAGYCWHAFLEVGLLGTMAVLEPDCVRSNLSSVTRYVVNVMKMTLTIRKEHFKRNCLGLHFLEAIHNLILLQAACYDMEGKSEL